MEGHTDPDLPGAVRLGTPPPEDMEDSSSPPIRISILLQAHNLPNADSRRQGKSDPFVYVEARYNATEDWVKIGMTETVWNNTSPQWATNISLQYSFGTTQLLRFRIFDRDSPDNDLRKHDFLGEVKCTVAHIVLADNQRITENVVLPPRKRHGLAHAHGHTHSHLKGGKNATLTIRAEEERGDLGDSVTLQFAVSALRRGSKPFYTLKRRNRNDNGFSPVRFSEVHKAYDRNKKNLFKPVTVSLARLVNADMNRTLRICFSEYDRKGNHYRGGHADFTLNQLRSMRANGDTPTFSLVKTKANGVKKSAGTLEVVRFEIANSYTFLDYIGAGVEINAVIAVDMSSTNGNPRDPSSLQYNSRESPNEYVLAIREVGNVLADYDTDKSFPAFGFSACLPPSFTQFSHCFALSGDFDHPDCVGIEGVINAYHDSLDHVAPHAPCLINPVLQHVIRIAAEKDRESNHAIYTVLLLITDGDFDDKQQVANSICAAAELPLSIVIVGIGNSEFPLLDELDGDEERLCNSDGVPAARDIVQVVHFYKHKDNPAALARETLDEIPTQLVSYMRSLGIRPKDIKPPPRPNISNPTEQLDSPSCEPSGGASEASPATPEPPSGNSYSAADILSLNILQGLHLDTPLNSVPQVSQPMLAHAQHQASSQSSIGALSSNTPPIVTGYGGAAGTHIPSSPAHLVHQPTMPVPQQLQSSPAYPYSSGGSLPPPLDNSLPPPLEMPPPVLNGSLPPPLHNSPFSSLNADPQAQRVQQQQPSLSSGALFPSMVLNLPPGAVPVAPEHSMQLPVHVPSTSGTQFPPHVLQGHLHRPT